VAGAGGHCFCEILLAWQVTVLSWSMQAAAERRTMGERLLLAPVQAADTDWKPPLSSLVADAVDRWLAKDLAADPVRIDQLTMFDHCIARDWLRRDDRLLPLLMSVGAHQSGMVIPLVKALPGTDSLTGFACAKESPFDVKFVRDALSLATWTEHETRLPDGTRLPRGRHLELDRWYGNGAFRATVTASGLSPKYFAGHVCRLSGTRFYARSMLNGHVLLRSSSMSFDKRADGS
jgi:hypothetical protein